MIVAMLSAHGTITREQVTAWRIGVLAVKPLADPRAYIAKMIRDNPRAIHRQVVAGALPKAARQPAPVGQLCRRCGKPHPPGQCAAEGEATPADDAAAVREHGGAATARKLLGVAQPVEPEPAEADPVDADLPDW